jgi:membrane protein
MLLSTIETTFNDIWGVTHGRTWLARIIQYWATVTLGPLIPILAIALNAGSQIQTVETWLSGLPVISDNTAKFIFFIALKVVPFVVLSVAFALFYQLMPNTRVRWQAALVGGIVGGCLWQLNSLFSVVYISRVEIYTSIYGPLSLVPIFLIGLYFSWLILLFGAQVAYTFQNRLAYFQERQSEAVNELGREFVALRIMTCLARRFSQGSRPPTEIELGQTLAVPTRLVGDVMKPLTSAGLIHEVEGVETGYTVARPLEKLTCQDILSAIRRGDGEDLETNEDADRALLREQFARIQNAEASVAGKLSLAMLVQEEPAPEHLAAVPAEILEPSEEVSIAGHKEAASKVDRDS